MSQINQLNAANIPVANAQIPAEGPKCVPLTLDFTAASTYTLDYGNMMERAFISMIQTVYIDAKDSAVTFTLTVPRTGQILTVKPHTQGYYPVLCPNPVTLQFDCAGGPSNLGVFLINVPIAPAQWATQ